MNEAEAGVIEAFLDYLSNMPPMEAAGFLIVAALCWRLVRGSSIKELIGLKNDIVRGNEFRSSIKDINGRLDRHFQIVEEVRDDVSKLGEKVAKLDGQIEQFRNK